MYHGCGFGFQNREPVLAVPKMNVKMLNNVLSFVISFESREMHLAVAKFYFTLLVSYQIVKV